MGVVTIGDAVPRLLGIGESGGELLSMPGARRQLPRCCRSGYFPI